VESRKCIVSTYLDLLASSTNNSTCNYQSLIYNGAYHDSRYCIVVQSMQNHPVIQIFKPIRQFRGNSWEITYPFSKASKSILFSFISVKNQTFQNQLLKSQHHKHIAKTASKNMQRVCSLEDILHLSSLTGASSEPPYYSHSFKTVTYVLSRWTLITKKRWPLFQKGGLIYLMGL